MELLDIKTPTITRIQYANLDSKNVWGAKIERGKNVFPSLEYLTVKHGVRPSMIAHTVHPDTLDQYARDLARDGLLIVPVAKTPLISSGFGHVQGSWDGNGPFVYRCVITPSITTADEFVQAHLRKDDVKIGELLGFPTRSGEFFEDAWGKGYFDPIWQQAENTTSHETLKNRRDFTSPSGGIEKKLIRLKASDENWKISSVFRYIGIRFISHFAYSMDDKESIEVANNWISLAEELKLDGLQDAKDILQLPYEWDCLKGFAEINTPVFKVVTSSMPCYPNHIIQQESDFYPEEAPNGIQFPWRNPLFAPKK